MSSWLPTISGPLIERILRQEEQFPMNVADEQRKSKNSVREQRRQWVAESSRQLPEELPADLN